MRPWCLGQPINTQAVFKTITSLLEAGDWHIAVRSGGYSSSLANNIQDGVTIDLGKLNQTTYDKTSNIGSIGPGGRWMNVYGELHSYGVLVTGGCDGDVGVAGFLLGGGMISFMGRHGFGCDSVKNFEIVPANVNQLQNPDLYKALEGGGNFGIVTRFDKEALPDTPLTHGTQFMSGHHSNELAEFAVDFTDTYNDHQNDALVSYYSHDASASYEDITAMAIHANNQNKNNGSRFEGLKNTLSLVEDKTESVSLFTAVKDSQLSGGTWNTGAALSFKNDKRITKHVVKEHEKLVRDLKRDLGSNNFVNMFFFQPLPQFLGDISSRNGGNMLGIDFQEHDAILFTEVKSYSVSVGGENNLVFMNFAEASQDPLGSYGKANVEHMEQVAAKYDPMGAFQERIPGGFKISRVA